MRAFLDISLFVGAYIRNRKSALKQALAMIRMMTTTKIQNFIIYTDIVINLIKYYNKLIVKK